MQARRYVKPNYSIFEALVEPFNNHNGNGKPVVRKLHYERTTQEQARREAAEHGIVKSVYKVDEDSLKWNPESIKIEEPPPDEIDLGIHYDNAIAMDEFTWKKVQKRRHNMTLEKKKIFE